MLGVRYGVLEMQDDAIEAGVGEYYIDEDNTKQFRFVQPIPAEQNE